MAWIDTIDEKKATDRLREIYEAVLSPMGHIDNLLKAHSLRPRTLEAHLSLYKAVLHSRPNALSPRERELVGVCVSPFSTVVATASATTAQALPATSETKPWRMNSPGPPRVRFIPRILRSGRQPFAPTPAN